MTDPSMTGPINRCTAHRRNGDPCKNRAIRGTNVCRVHGGSAPQVKRAAFVRLLMESDPAAAELIAIYKDKKNPIAARLRAIENVLDRAGVAAKQEVDLDVQITGKLSVYEQIVLDSTLPVGVYDDLDGPLALPDPNVIDAEVVEDAPAPVQRARELEMDDAERNAHRREKFLQKQRAERTTPPSPAPSIADDPRDRQPVRSRDEALT